MVLPRSAWEEALARELNLRGIPDAERIAHDAVGATIADAMGRADHVDAPD